jgi:uncharacterized protein (TIGR02452 family)
MPNRAKRARIAAGTVQIVRSGHYVAPSGRTLRVGEMIAEAVAATVLVRPDETPDLRSRAAAAVATRRFTTAIDVRNETTFAAARRLVGRCGEDRVAALNFASAKNPGGGFLSGSQAQEESHARASALVACLEGNGSAYYDANRRERSLLYTDHLIVSPRVPVFRDDDDRLLEDPYRATILTMPAPNRGAIAKNDPAQLRDVEPTFRRRIELVLAAAAAFGQTALVLGAWGCGVFANDPRAVARLFAEQLTGDGPFARAFEHVTFAVLDRPGGDTIRAFEDVLGH